MRPLFRMSQERSHNQPRSMETYFVTAPDMVLANVGTCIPGKKLSGKAS